MKRLLKFLTGHTADLMLVIGAAAITVGFGMVYLPAGFVAGGVLMIFGAVLESRSGGESA